MWLSGDILGAYPAIIGGYGFSDSISDVVYKGHLGYHAFPGFQVYLDYSREWNGARVSSAVKIDHRWLPWLGSARMRCVIFFRVIIRHVFYSCRRGWSSQSGGTAVLTLGWAVVYWVIPGNSTELARWQRRHSEVSSTCVGAVSISWTLYIGGLFILASLLRVLSTRLIGFFFSGSGIFEQSGARG